MAQRKKSDGFPPRWLPAHLVLVYTEDLMLVMIV